MIAKDRIFKKGDVIVSGFGNVRILVGETGYGKAGDGAEGVFYDAVPPYCTSDAPAGTDMRYARHANARERKRFFQVLEANGLKYDAKTCTVKAGEEYTPEDTENYTENRYNGEAMPFKVVKKRIRPTLKEVNELKSGLENERRLHIHFAKVCDQLEANIKVKNTKIDLLSKEKSELKDHLDEVKGCNEKMAKDLAILQEDNDKLKAKNTALEQSNKLMEDELDRQKRANENLSAFNDQYKKRITELENRGFWARVFNK